MELHSQYVAAKKAAWICLRLAFFMVGKSFISKRKKLMMDVCFLLKKKGKPLWKNLIMLNHHSSRRSSGQYRLGKREYEFSFSNSPIPPFLRAYSSRPPRRRRSFFSCIDIADGLPRRPEGDHHEPNYDDQMFPAAVFAISTADVSSANSMDEQISTSPLIMSPDLPALDVSISDFSSDEEDGDDHAQLREEINEKAEEFIKKFYQQLMSQCNIDASA